MTKITIFRYSDADDNLINNDIKCRDNNALVTRKNILVFNFKNGESGAYEVSDQDQLNKAQQSVLNQNMSVRNFLYKNGGFESFSSDEFKGNSIKEGRLISSGGDITYPELEHHHTEDVAAPSEYIMRMHPRGPGFARKSTSENIPAFVSLINKEISAFKIKEKNVTGVKVSINLVTLSGNVALANEYKNQLSAIFPDAKIKVKPDKSY